MASFTASPAKALDVRPANAPNEAISIATETSPDEPGPAANEHTTEAATAANAPTSPNASDGPDPETLLKLLKASPNCQLIFHRYYRSILSTYAEEILPRDPQLVRDALQARYSDRCMIANVFSDNTFTFKNKAFDLWDSRYSGEPIKALEGLIELTAEVQSFADSLLSPVTMLPDNIRTADRATIEEALWLIEVEVNRGQNLICPVFSKHTALVERADAKIHSRRHWRELLEGRVVQYHEKHSVAAKLAYAIHGFFRTPEGRKLYRRIPTSQGLVFPRTIWMYV